MQKRRLFSKRPTGCECWRDSGRTELMTIRSVTTRKELECNNDKVTCTVMPGWWVISTIVKVCIVHQTYRGNWIGEAPYQHGRSCSQCPPSYGGGCRNNLCYKRKDIYNCINFNLSNQFSVETLAFWTHCVRTCRVPAPGDRGHERGGEAPGSNAAPYHS